MLENDAAAREQDLVTNLERRYDQPIFLPFLLARILTLTLLPAEFNSQLLKSAVSSRDC